MFKHILVPVDFTRKNARALEIAADIAAGAGTRLTLLHVIERIERIPADELGRFYATLERRAARRMGPLAARLAERHARVRGEIVLGNRRQEILRFAVRHRVDLIALSSHPIGPRAGGDRSISHDLAMVAPCAVLLVRQAGARRGAASAAGNGAKSVAKNGAKRGTKNGAKRAPAGCAPVRSGARPAARPARARRRR